MSNLIFSAGDNPNWNDVTDQTRLGTEQMVNFLLNNGLKYQITSGKRNWGGKSFHETGNGADLYIEDENGNRLDYNDPRRAQLEAFGKDNGWEQSWYHDAGSGYHLHLGNYGGKNNISSQGMGGNSQNMTPTGYDSLLNNAIQGYQNVLNNQDDPTARPYVKDKAFYDNIANPPIENAKMAAYRNTINNLELLKIANSRMPGNRESLMAIANGLMQQSSAAAEQGANIDNEMTKRKLVSDTLYDAQNVRNPMEMLNILKSLEATTGMKYNPAEVTSMLGSKESYNATQLSGALQLANLASGVRGQDLTAQLAQSRILAALAKGSGSTTSGISTILKNANTAWEDYAKLLQTITLESQDKFYQDNPAAWKDRVWQHEQVVSTIAALDPNNGKLMMDNFKSRMPQLIPDYTHPKSELEVELNKPIPQAEANQLLNEVQGNTGSNAVVNSTGANTSINNQQQPPVEDIRAISTGFKRIGRDLRTGASNVGNYASWLGQYPGTYDANNYEQWRKNAPYN